MSDGCYNREACSHPPPGGSPGTVVRFDMMFMGCWQRCTGLQEPQASKVRGSCSALSESLQRAGSHDDFHRSMLHPHACGMCAGPEYDMVDVTAVTMVQQQRLQLCFVVLCEHLKKCRCAAHKVRCAALMVSFRVLCYVSPALGKSTALIHSRVLSATCTIVMGALKSPALKESH